MTQSCSSLSFSCKQGSLHAAEYSTLVRVHALGVLRLQTGTGSSVTVQKRVLLASHKSLTPPAAIAVGGDK